MSEDRKKWSHEAGNKSVYAKKYHKVKNEGRNKGKAKVAGGLAVFIFSIGRFFFDLLSKGILYAFKGLWLAISFIFRLFTK